MPHAPRAACAPAHATAACAAPASGEMLVAGMRELHHSTVAYDHRAGTLAQHPDLTVVPLRRSELALQLGGTRRVHRKQQLVVIAGGECELARRLPSERLLQRARHRELGEGDLEPHTARGGELARIAEQPVRDVDA